MLNRTLEMEERNFDALAIKLQQAESLAKILDERFDSSAPEHCCMSLLLELLETTNAQFMESCKLIPS